MVKPILDTILDETRRLVGDVDAGLVAAVSGGPDSVALAVALARSVPVTLVHVHHQLRAADADADAESVIALGQRCGVPVIVERVDVLAVSTGSNIEAVARRLRYDALTRVAGRQNAAAVLTGHTLDDQAETVLLRLLRGTGLGGLAGIRPRIRWHGCTIARPLLGLRRAALVTMLEARDIPYRIDASNADPRFDRNALRAELMPIVARLGRGDPVERIAGIADEARLWSRVQARRVRGAIARCELPEADDWRVFHAERLAELPESLRRELWRAVWRREDWPAKAMTRSHWRRVARVGLDGIEAVDCPGGIRVRHVQRVVRAGPNA